MPEFILKKIVRDNFKEEYPKMEQKAKFFDLKAICILMKLYKWI